MLDIARGRKAFPSMESIPRGYQFVREYLVGNFWALPTGQVETGASTEPNAKDVESANLRQKLEAQQRETHLLRQQLHQQQMSQRASNQPIQQPSGFANLTFQAQQQNQAGFGLTVIHPQKQTAFDSGIPLDDRYEGSIISSAVSQRTSFEYVYSPHETLSSNKIFYATVGSTVKGRAVLHS